VDHVLEILFFLKESVNQFVHQAILLLKADVFQKNANKDKNSTLDKNVLIFVLVLNKYIKTDNVFVLMDITELIKFVINAQLELIMILEVFHANHYVEQIVNIEMENVTANLVSMLLIINVNNVLMAQFSMRSQKDVKIFVKQIKFTVLKDAFALMATTELMEFVLDVHIKLYMIQIFKNVFVLQD
jgi:hypothetical protein